MLLLFVSSFCFWYDSTPLFSVERRPAKTAATPIIPSWYTFTNTHTHTHTELQPFKVRERQSEKEREREN